MVLLFDTHEVFVSQKVQPSKVLIELRSFAHISASSLMVASAIFFSASLQCSKKLCVVSIGRKIDFALFVHS